MQVGRNAVLGLGWERSGAFVGMPASVRDEWSISKHYAAVTNQCSWKIANMNTDMRVCRGQLYGARACMSFCTRWRTVRACINVFILLMFCFGGPDFVSMQ